MRLLLLGSLTGNGELPDSPLVRYIADFFLSRGICLYLRLQGFFSFYPGFFVRERNEAGESQGLLIHLAKVFFLNADFYVVTWYRWELVHTFLTSDKDDLFQVSYLGTVHLEVIAKRLSLPDNLVRGGTFPFYRTQVSWSDLCVWSL